MRNYLPDFIIISIISLIFASFAVFIVSAVPMNTDSRYHFNAAQRFAQGDGLIEDYVWVYIGQPPAEEADFPLLQTPSHLYWMPFTSLVSGVSMRLLGDTLTPYQSAQLPLLVMYAVTLVVTYFLGVYLGSSRRNGIVAFLLLSIGGFYLNHWGQTDTFANYALIGSLCLVVLGKGALTSRWYWFALAGVLTGLAHLTRSDGMLFIIVALMTIGYAWLFGFKDGTGRITFSQTLVLVVAFIVPYLLVMLPWFVRMFGIVGAPLPLGGLDSVWLRTYDELFNFPPGISPSNLFVNGLSDFFNTRWLALTSNVQTLVAVEGIIVVFPFMLMGLWRKRGAYVFPMFWFAVGLHVSMTLVFPLPGLRGTLLHGAVALMPWWMALGTVGLDMSIDWAAKRLPHWNPARAKVVFSGLLIGVVILFTFLTLIPRKEYVLERLTYEMIDSLLAEDARVMSASPTNVYYFTGRGGTVTPNIEADDLPEVARIYATEYLIVTNILYDEESDTLKASMPEQLKPIIDNPPDFLTPIDIPDDVIEATIDSTTLPREDVLEALQGVRIYAFNR